MAKARRKRGGREGGVLLDRGYNDALAAVREQAASGLRVRSCSAVRLFEIYPNVMLTGVVWASAGDALGARFLQLACCKQRGGCR